MADGLLAGKSALVTGAGSGIGRAIALRFAAEGARVGLNWLHNQRGAERTLQLMRESGGEGMLVRADVSRDRQVRAMIGALADAFGDLDVVVCNSGIGTETSPDRVAEISVKDWDRVIDVNLKGMMLVSKHSLPGMIRRGSGSIIAVSSIRGLLGNPSLASYCASKGGEVLLAKQMAVDYAHYGVRVNCICPGFILTEMLQGYIAKQSDPEEARRAFAAMSPMNRVGSPEEIASAALFLASQASSFVVGAALPVDGGYTACGVRAIL